MKVLVTGSSGFIGTQLVRVLRKAGHEVFPYDIKTGQDLMRFEELEESIKKVDAVYHLAAQADLSILRERPYDGTILNVGCTHNVAHLCAKHKKWLIYISTVCVYGNQDVHPTSEKSLPNPSEIYACTKLAGEWIVRGYGITYEMPWNICRIATTYGVGMREALGTHIFFKQALKGKNITVHGDGKQDRTLTCVQDIAEGLASVIEHPEAQNEIFNITQTEIISANKMAEDIKEITGSDSKIVHIPQRPNQTIHEEFDISKAEKLLKWKPKITWKQGLKKMYKWMKTQV